MVKITLFFALLAALMISQVSTKSCNSFVEGTYDCVFTPSSNYITDYIVETFTLDITNTDKNDLQTFTIDSDFCASGETGTVQIQSSSTATFTIDDSCDYILFGDSTTPDNLKSANYNSACNTFSGTVDTSDKSNNIGKLSCSINTVVSNTLLSSNNNNNGHGNSSSALALIPSFVLSVFAFLFALL